MVECKICMELFPVDVFQFLPCTHKLCQFCFKNLKKTECPFCKYSFSDEVPEEREDELYEEIELADEPHSRRRKKKNKKKRRSFLFDLSRTRENSSSSTVSYTRFEVLNLD